MDPAHTHEKEKLEKVYEAVCEFLKWSGCHRLGQRSSCGSYIDDEDILRRNVQDIMGVEIEEYN